jgi:hypothetical protein
VKCSILVEQFVACAFVSGCACACVRRHTKRVIIGFSRLVFPWCLITTVLLRSLHGRRCADLKFKHYCDCGRDQIRNLNCYASGHTRSLLKSDLRVIINLNLFSKINETSVFRLLTSCRGSYSAS